MSASNYLDDLTGEVLPQFQCPGICNGSYLAWEGSTLFEATFVCPFAHPRMDAEDSYSDDDDDDDDVNERDSSNLRKMPPYVCVEHLMRMCRRDTKGHSLVNSPPMVKCSAGFHLPIEDLIDLEQLQIRAFSLLANFMDSAAPIVDSLSVSQQPTTSKEVPSRVSKRTREEANLENAPVEEPECGICIEKIVSPSKPFGLLSECTHVFCAACIIDWFQRAGSKRACPICRKVSKSISIWPTMVKTQRGKKEIAKLQGQATNGTQPYGQ